MSGFTKLDSKILTSSVWQCDHATRIVWITILALKDKNGFVAASLPGLTHAARVTREECETALSLFEAPDPDSRTPDNDGRKLERVDGGWVVLNHFLYRDLLSDDPETVQARIRMQKFRQRHPTLRNVTGRYVTRRNGSVTSRNAVSVSGSGSGSGSDPEKRGTGGEPAGFLSFWSVWPKHPRKTNRKGCLAEWTRRNLEAQADAVMAGLNAWVHSEKWQKDGGQYIEAPIVFLRQERWEDMDAARAKFGPLDPPKSRRVKASEILTEYEEQQQQQEPEESHE